MLVQDEKWAPLAAAWTPAGAREQNCLVGQQRESGAWAKPPVGSRSETLVGFLLVFILPDFSYLLIYLLNVNEDSNKKTLNLNLTKKQEIYSGIHLLQFLSNKELYKWTA